MKKSIIDFFDKTERHEIFVMAAALAYATALALAPFVLIILSLVSVLEPGVQQQISQELTNAFGGEVGSAVRSIIDNVDSHPKLSGISSLIGFAVLAVSASIIFSQLRIALDKINEYEVPPHKNNIWLFFRNKFLSIGLVLAFAFMSIVSLLVTAFVALLYPNEQNSLWRFVSLASNYLLFSFIFTLIYRFIPSEQISWRRCFLSGAVSTVFYLVGKNLIGVYLAKAGLGSPYGAAGSLIVFLAWVYYTALTLLLSYEISTHLIFVKKPARSLAKIAPST